MAQQIQTLFIDDIDGGPAEGTVRFGLDGTDYEIDLSVAHSEELHKVLAVRDAQGAELERWLSAVTPDELSAPAPVPAGRGWPPYARGKSVLECVRVVLGEEWAHHGFCVRDLDLLDSPPPGTAPKQEPAAGH